MEFVLVFTAGLIYDFFFVGRLGTSSLKLLGLVFLLEIIGGNFRFWQKDKNSPPLTRDSLFIKRQ